MPGPPPTSRLNRSDVALAWTVLPTDPEVIAERVGPIPELPPGHWQQATKEKWAAWWRLPVATQWTVNDRGAVERMAFLWDAVFRGEGNPAVHTRIDTVEANLGLTPKARVQLRWRIDGEEAPQLAKNGGLKAEPAKVSNLAEHRKCAREAAKGAG